MWFYSCHDGSQQKFRNFIFPVFNRVQLIHNRMLNFCATVKTQFAKATVAALISQSSPSLNFNEAPWPPLDTL
jgi:hypothetical protein